MINTDNATTILKDNNDNNTLIGLELFHFDNDKRHFIAKHFNDTCNAIDNGSQIQGLRLLNTEDSITLGFNLKGIFCLQSSADIVNTMLHRQKLAPLLSSKKYTFVLTSIKDIKNVAKNILASYHDYCCKLRKDTEKYDNTSLLKLLNTDNGSHIFFTPKAYIKYVYSHWHDWKPAYHYVNCRFMAFDAEFFTELVLADKHLDCNLNNNNFVNLVLNTLPQSIFETNIEAKLLLNLLKHHKEHLNKHNCSRIDITSDLMNFN